jgi:hypothetical protein
MPLSFKISPHVRYRVIDDEAVVVRQREGDVVVLNEVAARVLQLAGEGLSQERIGDRIVSEYEAGESQVRADVDGFLVELIELGVLERTADGEDVP